jgi:hypothetical protein
MFSISVERLSVPLARRVACGARLVWAEGTSLDSVKGNGMEISAIRPLRIGAKARIAALATTAAIVANENRGVIDADLLADYAAICWR